MNLNLGQRAMIVALQAAHPEMGKKKLTTEANKLLPAKMHIEKSQLRDFLRSRDEPTTSNPPVIATKPRDEAFVTGTANPIFHLLREAEREYLLNMDFTHVHGMHQSHSDSGERCHPVAHLRHHFVVLLVLMGFRPCVPFVSPRLAGIAKMSEMVLRCFMPLMEQFDLESYGFKLLYVAADVKTYDSRFHGFKGTWVLADTQSAGWRAVGDMFAMPNTPISAKQLCTAFGFPLQDEDEFYNKVEILDATEHAVLQDHSSQHTCKVGVLKIFCGQGDVADWDRIAEYYSACRELAAVLGTELTLDLCEHPRMRVWCWMTGRLAQTQSVIGA
ncbi:hypothetical protein DHEL01_v208574 [Diaporthe helianthi]|uniref:Uncharacterized protein n=1 Tax=Diaporthe helianthi TaxID=158607 RepID=A0A2P5HS02_DIAHE|nr:hypothetical protein DHEL01_v208574 [Diaporthe helianthi]